MNQERLMKVLLAPHLSEKANTLAEQHQQFVFRVASDATKPEIRKAVELMFDVKVKGVSVLNVKGRQAFRLEEGLRHPGSGSGNRSAGRGISSAAANRDS